MQIYISSGEINSVTTVSNRIPFVFSGSDTEGKYYNISGYGHIHSAVLEIPNFSNSVTASLKIFGVNDYQLYASTGNTKGEIHLLSDIDIIFDGNGKLQVEVSGPTGDTGGTVYVVLYLDVED